MSTTAPAHDSFEHPALFYRSEQEYLTPLLEFLREGLGDC